MHNYYQHITCPECGSYNHGVKGDWRWNGQAWQHRCAGKSPYLGHWTVDPPTNWATEAASVEQEGSSHAETSILRQVDDAGGTPLPDGEGQD